MESVQERSEVFIPKNKGYIWMQYLALTGVLTLVLLIYSPVIVNAFNGDDFVHLKWLDEAVHNPELVWRNFHAPWLDITTAKFYRPLISIFMLMDYEIWGVNGIGFHLTNVLCHVANTALLWLILKNLPLSNSNSKWNYIWCLAGAGLFGLYPLHPESVSWITGRVDTFVTLFFLAGLYAYMRAGKTGVSKSISYKWYAFSFVAMSLSLLCKEMAIILPAVFVSYEFIIASDELQIRERILNVLKKTSVFWFLLFMYFGLRYFSLGTFVGGYDNTLFDASSIKVVLSNWRHSLYFLFFPFNQMIISKTNPIVFIWGALLLANLVLLAKSVFVDRKNIPAFCFLIAWLVLSLAPVYKLLSISPDLQGTRLVYLASAPLCALLCFGFSTNLAINDKLQYWKIFILTMILAVSGTTLLVNNSAWIKAECETKALVKQIDYLSKSEDNVGAVYIVGLPDQIEGAYAFRNALYGVCSKPVISKNIDKCFNLDEINHVFPFGYARHTMKDANAGSAKSSFYVWNSTAKKLLPFTVPVGKIKLPIILDVEKDVVQNEHAAIINLKGHNCFDLDCLVVNLQIDSLDNNLRSQMCNCFYTNDLVPKLDRTHRFDQPLRAGRNKLIIPLHGEPDWALGRRARELKLVFPMAVKYRIESVTFEPFEKYMPLLSFEIRANQNDLGFIVLNDVNPKCKLNYDAGKVRRASRVALEISAPDQTFTVMNDTSSHQKVSVMKVLPALSGSIILDRNDFLYPAIYELRLRALDNDNKEIGIAGDHIVCSVK